MMSCKIPFQIMSSEMLFDSTNYYFADLYISNSSSANWSYPNWPSDIDHILVTNELFNYFTNSNVSTIRVDDYLVGGWSTYDNIILTTGLLVSV